MSTPRFRSPMLATLVDAPVEGDEWIFERKLDGVRLVAVRDGADVRLWSRNEVDNSATYPEVADALADQPCARFVLDGEVVAFDGDVTSFARLQRRSGIRDEAEARASGIAVHYYAFDLLHLDGEDVTARPLRERKSLLRDAIDWSDRIRFTAHRNRDGPALLEDACARGWEGLIAKRASSPYRSTRSRDWLKLKCVARQELVVGGFTDPKGTRLGFGALLVGYHEDDRLAYAGRVGTGFDTGTLQSLRSRLSGIERSTSPFADAPGGRDVHWVAPEIVCEVGFTEWTAADRLRHPRFLGLRHDKDPGDVVREAPASAPGR
jgi:bifunctional non-homologous end joining protein LigD